MPATEVDRVELLTVSKFEPKGIDAAIRKYERLQDLHTRMSSLTIRVHADGLDELNRGLNQTHSAVAKISSLRGFDQLSKQITSQAKALATLREELALGERTFRGRDYLRGTSADAGSRDQAKERARLDSQKLQIERMETEMGRVEKIRKELLRSADLSGVRSGTGGRGVPASGAAEKMRQAEEDLHAGATRTRGAIESQTRSTAAKARQTTAAAGEVSEFEKQEQRLGNTIGAVDAKMGRLQARYKDGELVSEKFQTGAADTTLKKYADGQETLIQTHNDLADSTDRLARIDAKYREGLKGAGSDLARRLTVTEDYRRSLQSLAKDSASYAGSPFGRQVESKLAGADASLTGVQTKTREQMERDKAALDRQKKAEEERVGRNRRTTENSLQSQRNRIYNAEQSRMQSSAASLRRQRDRARDKEFMQNYAGEQAGLLYGQSQEKIKREGYDPTSRPMHTWDAKGGVKVTETFRKGGPEGSGVEQLLTLTRQYNAEGKLMNTRLDETQRKMGALAGAGRLLKDAGVAATWIGVYSAIDMVIAATKEGIEATVEYGRKQATLRAVYRGTREDADAVAAGTLDLAARYGQSTASSIEAATEFARSGQSKAQVLESERVALLAANTAELSVADSSKYLSSVTAAYALEAGKLITVLDGVNAVSNNSRATTKDLLDGISRVGPLARQAGVGLNELTGMIGAMKEKGGTGTQAGTALKAMISRLAAPDLQQYLKQNYQLSVRTNAGELKAFPIFLRELHDKYETLTKAEQQELTVRLAGSNQASRIQGLLDAYGRSLELAGTYANGLGSAERENAIQMETVGKQLDRLKEQWNALFITTSSGTGIGDHLRDDIKLLTNLLWLLGEVPKAWSNLTQGSNAKKSDAEKAMNYTVKSVGYFVQPSKILPDLTAFGLDKFREYITKWEAQANGTGPAVNPANTQGPAQDNRGKVSYANDGTGDEEGDDNAPAYNYKEDARAAVEAARVLNEARRGGGAVSNARGDLQAAELEYEITMKRINLQVQGSNITEQAATAAKIQAEDDLRIEQEKYDLKKRYAEIVDSIARRERDAGTNTEAAGEVGALAPSATRQQELRDKQNLVVMQENLLLAAQRTTRAEMEKKGFSEAEIEAATSVLSAKREELEIDRQKLAIQQRYAAAMEAGKAGQRAGQNNATRFAVGGSEGEKLLRQSAGLAGDLMGLGQAMRVNSGSGTQDARLRAVQMEVQARTQLAQLHENEIRAESRLAEIEAEKRNLRIQENIEASKSLLLADREEQLQAVLLQRFLQRRGQQGFSTNEFQFLDKGTRENIVKYRPDAAPQGLNTPMQALEREENLLVRNFNALQQTIAGLDRSFAGLDPAGRAAEAAAAGTGAGSSAISGLNGILGGGLPTPNITIPVPAINIDIGDQAHEIFTGIVQGLIQPQLDKMWGAFNGIRAANVVNNAGAGS